MHSILPQTFNFFRLLSNLQLKNAHSACKYAKASYIRCKIIFEQPVTGPELGNQVMAGSDVLRQQGNTHPTKHHVVAVIQWDANFHGVDKSETLFNRRQSELGFFVFYPPTNKPDNLRNNTAFVVRVATITRPYKSNPGTHYHGNEGGDDNDDEGGDEVVKVIMMMKVNSRVDVRSIINPKSSFCYNDNGDNEGDVGDERNYENYNDRGDDDENNYLDGDGTGNDDDDDDNENNDADECANKLDDYYAEVVMMMKVVTIIILAMFS
ncbi:hypothetical protein PoB_001503100 [Plakobranchus ocellatus]|uniref:Uncharacterized protein n=1 Tax=Plakobranchus ocellatus TaxID=259542 RepID=A0AAV3Z1T3_9GAST|nr:hypothetical protein PoB_001503100 [Plakobranchus ocellatus]